MAQEATQEVGNLDLWPCTYAESRGICRDENGSHSNESGNSALRCHREGGCKNYSTLHQGCSRAGPARSALQLWSGFEIRSKRTKLAAPLPSNTSKMFFFVFFFVVKTHVMMTTTIITSIVSSIYTAALKKNALCGWCCTPYITESC